MLDIVYSQTNMFLACIIMGIAMGFTYDVFRGIRKAIHHSDIIVGLEDIIYWFFWTVIFIDNIFRFNDGEFRIYIFVISATGLVIYKHTISSGVFKITYYILYLVKKCVKKINKSLKNAVNWGKIKVSVLRNNKKDLDDGDFAKSKKKKKINKKAV
ncbi:MAG: spore cortex biosynthesis protein YabQ [Lachnospiraceae bacterium]|nr:spore cortex biosynthesis protein YabQ [Lachnospiraceae bacterium]